MVSAAWTDTYTVIRCTDTILDTQTMAHLRNLGTPCSAVHAASGWVAPRRVPGSIWGKTARRGVPLSFTARICVFSSARLRACREGDEEEEEEEEDRAMMSEVVVVGGGGGGLTEAAERNSALHADPGAGYADAGDADAGDADAGATDAGATGAGDAWPWLHVRKLLAAGRHEECAQLQLHWPLALACDRGHALFAHFVDEGDAPAVQFLVRRGAQVNRPFAARQGATVPLTAAIYWRDVDTVRVLLSARARVDQDMVARAAWHRAPGGVVEALYSARAAEFARAVLLTVQRRHPRQYDPVRRHVLRLLGYSAEHQGARGQGAPNQGTLGRGAQGQGAQGRGAQGQGARGQGAEPRAPQHAVTADFVRRTTECVSYSGASPLGAAVHYARKSLVYTPFHAAYAQTGARRHAARATPLELVTALLRCRADVHAPVHGRADDRGGLQALETVAQCLASTMAFGAPHRATLRRVASAVRRFVACPACPSAHRGDACTGMLGALGAAHATCVAHFAVSRLGPAFAVTTALAPASPAPASASLTPASASLAWASPSWAALAPASLASASPAPASTSASTSLPIPLPEALTHAELAAVNRLLLHGHCSQRAGAVGHGALAAEGPAAEGAVPDGNSADDAVSDVVRALLRRGILGIHRVVPDQPTPLEAAVRGSQWAAARVMLEFALQPRHRTTAAVARRAVRACSLSAHCPADVRAAVEDVERACARLPHKRPCSDALCRVPGVP